MSKTAGRSPKHSRIELVNRCEETRPGMEFRLQAVGRGKAPGPYEFSDRSNKLSPHRLKPELHTLMRTIAPRWSNWAFSPIKVHRGDESIKILSWRSYRLIKDSPSFRHPPVPLLIWLIALLLFISTHAWAADAPGATFEQANKLYEEGKYSEADTAYNNLAASGVASEALLFNRGNTFFKLGQVGRAIACYRQALWFAPRDADLRFNLRMARTRARGGVVYHDPLWLSLLDRLTVNEWTLLAFAAIWALFVLLAVEQWRPELKARVRRFTLAAAVVSVVLGACLVTMLEQEVFTRTAIVVTGEAEVRNGPLDESPSVYKVRDGVELEVVDEKDDWLQVVDSARRVGWLKRGEVLIFDPAASPAPKS